MGKRFLVGTRHEHALIPTRLEDYMPPDHLAHFIWQVIEQMDLSDLIATYRNGDGGRLANDPKGLMAVILYGHAVGIVSSRSLEQACCEQIPFRFLCGNVLADHSTISRFRERCSDQIAGLLGRSLALCAQAGLVKLGAIAIDGTKIKANASLEANRTYETLAKELEKGAAEQEKRIAERPLTRMGKAFRCEEERLKRLKLAKSQLEVKQADVVKKEEEKQKQHQEKEELAGRKFRGGRKKNVALKPDKEPKANPTDPDSRIMKTRKGYIQGYNAQIAVSKDQIILAVKVTNEANDQNQCLPMLEAAEKAVAGLKEEGHPKEIRAAALDAGYNRHSNLDEAQEKPYPVYIAMEKDRKQRKTQGRQAPIGRRLKHLTPEQRMKRSLNTKMGQKIYALRGQTVEPVNGN